MLNLYNEGNHELLFVRHVENIFDSIWLGFIFSNQMPVNVNCIKVNIKQILVDQFVQNCRSQIANSESGNFDSIFKQDFCLEPYLLRVDQQHRNLLTKFRVSNMKLPIETGRWYNISKEHRKCSKCSENVIGDEFHYLSICSQPEIVNLRVRYIPNYFLRNSNAETMAGMLSSLSYRVIDKFITFSKGFK